MDAELLRERAAIARNVRRFFDGRGYLEVDTPILAPDLIPESCLDVFKTAWLPPLNSRRRTARDYWLVPSPEIWMKKLIAAHRTDMYQICKCFRNRESSGLMHSPEFTMLEYYTMDADYIDSLDITEALFAALVADTGTSAAAAASLSPPFERLTMDEAFSRIAGFSLNEKLENGTLTDEARRLGLDVSGAKDDGEVYNLIFIHVIEPALPRNRPVALLDYPAAVPCLARLNGAGGRSLTRQRWELYVNGIELANCYSEETDAEQVREFFLSEQREKERAGAEAHAVDGDYWKIFLPSWAPQKMELPAGALTAVKAPSTMPDAAPQPPELLFPRCSGVALGLDRLIMALTGRKTIDAVLPFPMEAAV